MEKNVQALTREDLTAASEAFRAEPGPTWWQRTP